MAEITELHGRGKDTGGGGHMRGSIKSSSKQLDHNALEFGKEVCGRRYKSGCVQHIRGF